LNRRGRSQALAAAELLRAVPLAQVHASPLLRCQQTARLVSELNIGQPTVASSDLLKETSLGDLEGELKSQQSTCELTRHYQRFSADEVRYRVPGGENLHDVYARVERFFSERDGLLKSPDTHLIVAHRNLNKMIVKYLLGLSFEEGFRVEHEHQQLYLYFGASREFWSYRVEGSRASLTEGYLNTLDGAYA
jgi:broad specificity phosphatase PhoE